MNRYLIHDRRDEGKALFFGELAQQPGFCFHHLGFITFESFFDVLHAMPQQPVEQQRQFARQRNIGCQSTNPSAQSPVKTAQRFVHTPGQWTTRHAKHSSSPITPRFDAAFAFAALFASSRQPQPRNKMFLARPARHVGAHFTDQLQHHLDTQAGDLGCVPPTADARQQLLAALDGRRVLFGPFGRCQFQSRRAVRWRQWSASSFRTASNSRSQFPIFC